MASLDMDLATTPLLDLIGAAETIGSGRGLPAVIALYTGWIAAQPVGAPGLPPAWFNLGTEFANGGDAAAAANAYRRALAILPGFAPAAVNLGLQREREGEPRAALQVWAEALQSDESRIALLNHRGRLLEISGELAQAADSLRSSLLTRHTQPDAAQHWLHLRQKMCEWPVLTDIIPGLSRHDLLVQSGPLAALALTDDVPTQCAVAADFIARKTEPRPALAPPGGYRHDRIRVGYLSSDFCSHAMSYLIVELFERHDRSRFEIHGYCTSPEDGSPIRARVIAAFDRFTLIRSLSDETAAQRIRDDEIDILIDLNGLTGGARPQILRSKPAPVQATYLGYIGPVPLPELDYILCDDFVIPPAIAAAYQPTPLPIEGLYQANDSKRVVGTPVSRQQVGLPDDRFVFCCFSNHYKITEEMFAGWTEILRRTGNAVLWLTDDDQWSRQNLRMRALVAGVDPDRLLFAGRTDPASYIARLRVADLFLDTFPYNAGTIASDAIRMGLPLLTLAGQSFASRMAARMLHAIGADSGVTTTLDAYVATAVTLATQRDTYAAYRAYFSETAWAASLGDIAGFTRRFEAALLRMAETCSLRVEAGACL
jgi:predicted O-linked N-acetylglucosamine transferase (SPINDLY family)